LTVQVGVKYPVCTERIGSAAIPIPYKGADTMKRTGGCILRTTAFLAAFVFLRSTIPAQAAVRVGFGDTIITPAMNMPMAGYARTSDSDGVHDDLHARSIAIEGNNGTSAILMTLSIVEISRRDFDAIRTGVSAQTGIPAGNIVISCTHTHSGPAVQGADHPYTRLLIARSIESGVNAWKSRAPARIGFGSGIARELGRDDRRLLYGGLHPDPEVGIIKVESTAGKLLGVAFVYGCHPSTLDLHNLKFTEDWPGYAIRGIREQVGNDVWAAFFQSAEGDIKVGYTAELSANGADIPIRTFEYAEYKGSQMVDAVMKALPSIATSGDLDVAAAEKSFALPAREGYRLTVEQAQKQADAAKSAMDEALKHTDVFGPRVIDAFKVENYLATLRLGAAKQFNAPSRPQTIPIFQQAVRIGDTAIVTFPCEVFSEIGLKVKQQSPVKKTFVVGLAGAMDGYLPTADEFKEEGYAALISPFSPKAEQALINSSLDMIGMVQDVKMKGKGE
jgi:neutral ceramidase